MKTVTFKEGRIGLMALSSLGCSILLSFALTFNSAISFAAGGSEGSGPGSGGGGKGVLINRGTNQQKVELLDLWEADVLKPLGENQKVITSDEDVTTQVVSVVDQIKYSVDVSDRYFPEIPKSNSRRTEGRDTAIAGMFEGVGSILSKLVNFDLNLYLSKIRHYPGNGFLIKVLPNIELSAVNDSFEKAKPKDADLVQIVNFDDNEKSILISKDLTDKMDNTNLAALSVHEGYYRFLRTGIMADATPDRDSRRARRVVGAAFSGYTFKSLFADLPQRLLMCDEIDAHPTYFFSGSRAYFYLARKGELRVRITRLQNRFLIGVGQGQSYVTFDKVQDNMNGIQNSDTLESVVSQLQEEKFTLTTTDYTTSVFDRGIINIDGVKLFYNKDNKLEAEIISRIPDRTINHLSCQIIDRSPLMEE